MPAPSIDHLSYSSIQCYKTCPRSWAFRYIEQVQVPTAPALVFGTAFHKVIEQAIRAATAGEPLDLEEYWLAQWDPYAKTNATEVVWGEASHATLREDGLRMLRLPETARLVREIRPLRDMAGLWIERNVKLHIPGIPVPITGYIDLVDQDSIPHDFKTAGRAWSQEQAQKEEQPAYYLTALNQSGNQRDPLRRFRHVVWTKGKNLQLQIIETRRTWGEILRVLLSAVAVWRGIEAGVFPCNTGSWLCSAKWCGYWSACQGKS